MGRHTSKLTNLFITRTNATGRYADGGGLYLQVSETGTKSWLFRYTIAGRAREMGLGPVGPVSLADARDRAQSCRRQRAEGKDPIEEKSALRRAQEAEEARAVTFATCASAYIASHRPGWKNAKHAEQWENTLKTYAQPVLGHLPVQEITTDHVLKVLEPIWLEKSETANRLRGRLEAILSYATARKLRGGENPAQWRGHLDKLLPRPRSVRRVVHHAALPFDDVPSFLAKVRQQTDTGALALEFTVLTACRTNEVTGARWSEFDFNSGTWTIPGERMKAKAEHRVPLTPRMLEILTVLSQKKRGDFVFSGRREGRPISNMTMLVLLRRMGMEVTTHGFRSSFRDWAAERTNYPREVAEAALAHTVRDKVEAAYRRGDLFAKRQRLMLEWDRFCLNYGQQKLGEIVSLAAEG